MTPVPLYHSNADYSQNYNFAAAPQFNFIPETEPRRKQLTKPSLETTILPEKRLPVTYSTSPFLEYTPQNKAIDRGLLSHLIAQELAQMPNKKLMEPLTCAM